MPLSPSPPADPSAPRAARGRASSALGLAHPLPAGMRDLLPAEARRQLSLARAVLGSFERCGYELVSVPPFEYADVLEQELGAADADRLLRFVEPETGEVVALRPDMTPQIARLISTRLTAAPAPLRLCYEGSVVRRRRERARRDRQIHQAGIELVGLEGARGDVEVLSVATGAVRAAGLDSFTVDLSHAMIASSLLSALAPAARDEVVAALAIKDGDEVRRRAESHGLGGAALAALVELPTLYGGMEVFDRAERLLAGTTAEGRVVELRKLADAIVTADLAPSLVVDLGETWTFSYYTGAMFHILAEGPGEPVGSGGRYDRLFDRFGASRAAAGCAIDLGNLAWAVERRGRLPPVGPRVLVAGDDERRVASVLERLRLAGVACAAAPDESVEQYARVWRFSHTLSLDAARPMLRAVDETDAAPLDVSGAPEIARVVAERIGHAARTNKEIES